MPKKKEVKREKEENLHAKHRARLKEKFLKAFDEGTLDDVFVDHELIELLLYCMIYALHLIFLMFYLVDLLLFHRFHIRKKC